MKHTNSYGIVDGGRCKEGDPVLGLNDLASQPDFGRRKYRGVFPQPMNSINTTAEVEQSIQNKHPPKGDDPALDFRPQRELLRMTLPAPETVIRPYSLR
jgi:hypothetical protein